MRKLDGFCVATELAYCEKVGVVLVDEGLHPIAGALAIVFDVVLYDEFEHIDDA